MPTTGGWWANPCCVTTNIDLLPMSVWARVKTSSGNLGPSLLQIYSNCRVSCRVLEQSIVSLKVSLLRTSSCSTSVGSSIRCLQDPPPSQKTWCEFGLLCVWAPCYMVHKTFFWGRFQYWRFSIGWRCCCAAYFLLFLVRPSFPRYTCGAH